MWSTIKTFAVEVTSVITENPAATAVVALGGAVVGGVASYYGGKKVGQKETRDELANELAAIKEELAKKADKA